MDEIVHFANLQPILKDGLQEIKDETGRDSTLQELIHVILTDGLKRYLKLKMQ